MLREMLGPKRGGKNQTEHKRNLETNQTRRDKISWTDDEGRLGQNDQKSMGAGEERRESRGLLSSART